MNVLPESSSRVRFVIEYHHTLVPLEEVVKLGDSYKPYDTEEEIPPVHDELFQYRDGQSASWSSLPAELRSIIYKYAYVSPPKGYSAFHMKIYSGHVCRTKWWKKVKDLSLNDDDIVVQFPHLLANRFVSKQWLFETADTVAKLRNWHAHMEDKTWDFAISVCERTSTDMSTLDQMNLTICAIMLHHISRTTILVASGRQISKTFRMQHFETCGGLEYIQVKQEDWWDKQYWINDRTSDPEDPDSADVLEIVTFRRANTDTDTDPDLTDRVRKSIHTVTRETADALKTQYRSSVYEDDGLPENMRASVLDWAMRNAAFDDFNQMFKEWNGPKPPYPSEFIISVCCAIEGEPKRSLCFELRIETCNRMLVKVSEQESKIYNEEETTGDTVISPEQNQQHQEQVPNVDHQPQPVDAEPNAAAAIITTAQTIEQNEATMPQTLEGAPAETAGLGESMPEQPREGEETQENSGLNVDAEGVTEALVVAAAAAPVTSVTGPETTQAFNSNTDTDSVAE